MRQLEGRIYAHEPEYQFNTRPIDRVVSAPTWTETLHASIGYNYKSFFNAAYLQSRYGDVDFDDSLNVMDEIKGTQYEQYYNDFKDAKNINHLNDLKAQVDAMQRRRQILANSSLFSQFTVGLFDPLNLIALPFGGPALVFYVLLGGLVLVLRQSKLLSKLVVSCLTLQLLDLSQQ